MALANMLKIRLLTPLYISFFVLMLLMVGQGSLSFLIGFLHQQVASWVTYTLMIESQGEGLLSDALKEETSMGDYLLTNDKAFLESYRKEQTAFRSRLNHLYILVQDNPAQLKHLDEIKDIHDRWQSQFAQRAISGSATRSTLVWKTLPNPLHTQVQALLQHEKTLLGERNHRLHQLNQMKTALDILSTVAFLAGVSLNLWFLARRLDVSLRQLTEAAQAWRDGKMEVQLDYGFPNEIGRLAGVLNAMASEIRYRQEQTEARNRQLEELIATLSHDLRTPLLATRTTLDSLLRGGFGPVSDTCRDLFKEYRQANEDLLKLLQVLLDVSRYEAEGGAHLSCEPLDWEKMFFRSITQVKATLKRRCNLTYKISRSLPTVYGDQIEIQRVLQNLLDNAVRVSEPDKPISLEVAPLGVDLVKISVRDNGPGIALQERQWLFQRFTQERDQRGSAGLGLYLCHQIVEAHGGTINVESTLGSGSTFWFTLPVAKASIQYGSDKAYLVPSTPLPSKSYSLPPEDYLFPSPPASPSVSV